MFVYHLKLSLPDLLPYLLSLILTFSVAIFTFRRRSVLGARSFYFVIFIELLQTGAYILELVNMDLPGKIFWDNFHWYTTLFFPVGVLFFAHEYIGRLRWRLYRWIWILAGVSLLLSTLITLDVFPGMGILAPRLATIEPFSVYTYEFGPLLLGASFYSYTLVLAGLVVLGWEVTRQKGETVIRERNLIRPDGEIIPVEMHTKMMPGGSYQSIYHNIHKPGCGCYYR